MSAFMEGVITIALAIIGLAVVSVLVSRNAQTSSVIQSAASGFNNALGVAESPVTGSKVGLSLGYPVGGNQSYSFGS